MPDADTQSEALATTAATSRGVLGRIAGVRPPFSDIPGPFQSARRSERTAPDLPTPDQERGMRAFWWDGFWSNVPETVLASYLGLYVLAFGGTTGQVGLIASLSSLCAALAFFPGARFVETYGHRKRIVLWTGGGVSRVALFGLAFVPWFAHGDTAIWIVIALVSLRGFLGYFAIPAWTSLTADVVPLTMRGRFFASRNFGMSASALATAPIAGFLLDRYSDLAGWQIVWFLVAAAAAISTWCFARIPDPAPHRDVVAAQNDSGGLRRAATEILGDRNFVWYLVGTASWNVGLQASGPFFNVYLQKHLHASSTMIGALTALMSVTGLFGLLYFGRLMDQRGTKWLMIVCGLFIPLLPAMWLFVTAPWQVTFINAPGGIIWAGYQLATLNMVMIMAPADRRARYAAAFQTVVFAAAFVGPLLGGQIIAVLGFKAVFVFSCAGRLIGTLIVWRGVRGDGTPAAATP